MCGIFGFIANGNRRPNTDILRTIATVTQSRGRHAFGLAWVDDAGLHTYKSPGAIADKLFLLDALYGAKVIIGHCRYATHGSPDDNTNNHPHKAGRGFLVHNGVVGNYHSLARSFNVRLESECDSEILGAVIARTPGSLATRAVRMAERAEGNLAVMGVWTNPNRLLLVRNGNPLHFGSAREGFYFGSLAEGIPSPESLEDHQVVVMSQGGAKVAIDSIEPVAFRPTYRGVTWDKVRTYAK